MKSACYDLDSCTLLPPRRFSLNVRAFEFILNMIPSCYITQVLCSAPRYASGDSFFIFSPGLLMNQNKRKCLHRRFTGNLRLLGLFLFMFFFIGNVCNIYISIRFHVPLDSLLHQNLGKSQRRMPSFPDKLKTIFFFQSN